MVGAVRHTMCRITAEDASRLLIRQTGGVLPSVFSESSWYASIDETFLGVVLRGRGAWRWVLFQRESGLYCTVGGETREAQERAECGLLIKQRSLAA
jgi:hypothetical protein